MIPSNAGQIVPQHNLTLWVLRAMIDSMVLISTDGCAWV
jgi:hypothetical protein